MGFHSSFSFLSLYYFSPFVTNMPPNTLSHSPADYTQDSWIDDLINDTSYVDIEVASTDLFEGAWKVVKAVFPSWKKENVKFVQCKDGITNQCK